MEKPNAYGRGFLAAGKSKLEEKEAMAKYHSRLKAANLQPLADQGNYSSYSGKYQPCTIEAWNLHRSLLLAEGLLTNESQEEIVRAIERLLVNERMKGIVANLADGQLLSSVIDGHPPMDKSFLGTRMGEDELRLIAMQELSLHESWEFQRLRSSVIFARKHSSLALGEIYNSRPLD